MNNITKVTAAPVQVKLVPVSSVTTTSESRNSEPSQKTGNDLPLVAVPANLKPANIADRQQQEAHVQAAVAQMNEYIQSTQRDLHFSYDASSGETVVKVLDRTTQEVIRQIPDQIFLKIAQNFDKNETLHFLNVRA